MNYSNIRLHWKHTEMLQADPEELSSTVEQIGHQVEEKGFEIRSLQIAQPDRELDPEEDPGSIASIYKGLISTFPARGLRLNEIRSKAQASREIAVDVGLSNIGLLRQSSQPEGSSVRSLRKFIDVDPFLKLSEAASFIVSKWGEVPTVEKSSPAALKTRRRERTNRRRDSGMPVPMSQASVERVDESQSSQNTFEGGLITLSQPEPGRYGRRSLRKRTRKAGF